MAGRPSKLTPEMQERLCTSIAAGNFRATAAKVCGIDVGTLCRWLTKGKRGRKPYQQFRQALLAAEAKAELECVALIREASRIDARHAAWWLERKFPERWSRDRGVLRKLLRQVEELERRFGVEARSRGGT